LFTYIGMFLFSLVWSDNYWPPAPASMTGEPNLEALQFGFANAATLQEKLKIPAIVFGVVQALVLYGIFRAIKRREAPVTTTKPDNHSAAQSAESIAAQ